MPFKIESDIPLPERLPDKLREMDIGDSMVVELKKRPTIYQWGERHGRKFKVCKEGDMARCWRTA